MFFFDYDSYAWAMTCPDNKCDTDTRFMILDKNHKPEPRPPAILDRYVMARSSGPSRR